MYKNVHSPITAQLWRPGRCHLLAGRPNGTHITTARQSKPTQSLLSHHEGKLAMYRKRAHSSIGRACVAYEPYHWRELSVWIAIATFGAKQVRPRQSLRLWMCLWIVQEHCVNYRCVEARVVLHRVSVSTFGWAVGVDYRFFSCECGIHSGDVGAFRDCYGARSSISMLQVPTVGTHSWKCDSAGDSDPGGPNGTRRILTIQKQQNKYPYYRIRDIQSLKDK